MSRTQDEILGATFGLTLPAFTPRPGRPTPVRPSYHACELLQAVRMGDFIPAHDETHDLAEAIGELLTRFHDYVTDVRDGDQADKALAELGCAIAAATKEDS